MATSPQAWTPWIWQKWRAWDLQCQQCHLFSQYLSPAPGQRLVHPSSSSCCLEQTGPIIKDDVGECRIQFWFPFGFPKHCLYPFKLGQPVCTTFWSSDGKCSTLFLSNTLYSVFIVCDKSSTSLLSQDLGDSRECITAKLKPSWEQFYY